MSPGGPPAAPSWSRQATTTSAEGTRDLGAALARLCRPGDLLLLVGDLGAGKTTFAQGFARGLGVVGPVTSPTFTLVREYDVAGGGPVRQLLHADVYRLDSLAEVVDLGLPELAEDGAVVLVEWGDRAAPVLGESALVVTLRPAAPQAVCTGAAAEPGPGDHEGRLVELTGRGPAWAGRAGVVGEVEGEVAGGTAGGAAGVTDAGGGAGGTADTAGRRSATGRRGGVARR